VGKLVSPEQVNDTAEMLQESLEYVWGELCRTYDVRSAMPDMVTLFEGANLGSEYRSAEIILANMLLEIIEEVDRFSPWYKLPARAFGLVSVRDGVTGCIRWILAPEGVKRWQPMVSWLAAAVRSNRALIQAVLLVENLMNDVPVGDPCIDARCRCEPPRTIRIRRSVLERAQIVCDLCQESFAA
jgi:hypothetical protein